MIRKHELPILEYDDASPEVLRPNHDAEDLHLPEKCVYAFLGDTIDQYARQVGAEVAETFETTTKTYPIYIVRQNGMEFCLCQAPLGASAAAQFMDCLVACGCKKIIAAGSCGVLTELAENEFLVPVKALRDEGTYLSSFLEAETDGTLRGGQLQPVIDYAAAHHYRFCPEQGAFLYCLNGGEEALQLVFCFQVRVEPENG
jgi:hypothetical protein